MVLIEACSALFELKYVNALLAYNEAEEALLTAVFALSKDACEN